MKVYRFDKEASSRRPGARSIADAINLLLDSYRIRAQFDESSLVAYWAKIVGKPIADRTSKVYIKDKVLFLEIDSAPLRNELVIAKSKLVQALNKEFEHEMIEDIVFL
jgi:predicted nucleic acid-binding Zn ribbon protein